MVATIGSWLCKIEIVTHHHTTNFVNLTSTQWLYSTAWSIAQHSWVLWLKFCLWHQINTINIFSPPPHATQLPPPSLFRGTLDDRAAIIQADALAGCQKCFTHCWYREDRCEQDYSLARWPPRLLYKGKSESDTSTYVSLSLSPTAYTESRLHIWCFH